MSLPTATLRHLFADVCNDQRKHLWPLVGLMIIGALAETVGLLLLVPLIAMASGDVEWPAAMPFDDPLSGSATDDRLVIIAILFTLIMVLRAWILLMRDRKRARLVIRYGASLRARYVAGLTARDWKRTHALGESGFQQALMTDAARVIHAVEQGLGVVATAFLLTIQGGAALLLSPSLTLAALILFALSAALALPLLRRSSQHGEAIAAAISETSEEGGRTFQAMKSAIAEGSTDTFLGEFERRSFALATAESTLAFKQARARAVANTIVAVAAVILMLAGVLLFEIEVALLIPLLVIFARLSGPAREAFFSFEQMVVFAPSFVTFEKAIHDLRPNENSSELTGWQRLEVAAVLSRIDEETTLGPFNLSIERGQWVGLSGKSGSGKSVLVDMIAGLIPPDEGSMLLDGSPATLTRNPGWSRGLSYVGQNALLLDGDLATNLRVAQVDEEIVGATGLDRLIERLGLHTSLGNRGSLLSGGEAQRVALARALHRRPSLLIIDEGTAALDIVAERKVLKEVRKLFPEMAVLMVAHRPESLGLTDRVHAID